jgi:hypothetical protein
MQTGFPDYRRAGNLDKVRRGAWQVPQMTKNQGKSGVVP